MKRKFDSSQSSPQSETNVLRRDIIPPSKPEDALQNISRLVISINTLGKEKNTRGAFNQTLTSLLEEFVEIIRVQFEDLKDWIDLAYQYSPNINELEIEFAHVVKFLGVYLKESSPASVLSAHSLNQLLHLLTFNWNVSKTLCLHGLSNLAKTSRIKGKLSTELLETILLSSSRGPLWEQHHASLLFSLSILIEHDALDREINIEKITPFLNRFKPFRLEANDYRNILCFYKSVNKRRPLNPTIIHSTITSCVNNISLQFNDALLDIFTSFAELLNEESVAGMTAIKADFIYEILERIIASSNTGILANQISRLYLQFARLAKVGAIEGMLSLELFEKILSQLELDKLPADILLRYFSALELLQQAGKTSRPVSDALINKFLNSAAEKASQVPGADIQCLAIAKSLIKSPELIEQNKTPIQKLLHSNLGRVGTNPEKIIKLLQTISFLRNHRFFDNDLSALLSKIRIAYSVFPEDLKIQLNEIMQHLKDSPHWLQSIRQAVGLEQRPVSAVHAASAIPSMRFPSAGLYKGPAIVQKNTTTPGPINNPQPLGNVRPTPASSQASAPITTGNEPRGIKRTASHPSRNSLAQSKSGTSSTRTSTDKPASWQNACQSNRIFSAIADDDVERLKTILDIREHAGSVKRPSKKQKEATQSTSAKPRLALLLKRPEGNKALTEAEREVFNFFRTVSKDALIKLIQTSNSVFFFHLLKACTHHNRYFLIEKGFFDEVFSHLSMEQLKQFIPHLEAAEIYRAEDSIMHVLEQLNERGRKNPGEASSLKVLKLEFFTRAREFHIDAGHIHLAERLNASIRRIEQQQINLTPASPSNLAQTVSTNPSTRVTSFARSTSGTRSLFTVNTSYLYDSEDMLAILRARLETFNFATVIGVSQINDHVQGNRIKDQLRLILAENAALNASHKIVLVLPIQVGNHWVGLLLGLTGRKVDSALYLDSLGKQPTENRQRLILKELTEAGLNTAGIKLDYAEQAIQQPVADYTSCGPCLVENFHNALSRQWPETSRMEHGQMLELRRNHASCLLDKRPDYYPVFQNKHKNNGASFPSIQQQLSTHGVEAENSRSSLASRH
ncbi:hypothetical protein B1207_00315 [Legionella quinlivanii]|uniref:Ubiquitin-like protease family profile domain-containing protein n=1 Tax=Legionella quinlivanii TaxID=45073 RepID=A0A364LNF7_9GAMM|nr:hypothetical protein [Legionella quinlivanii]RAP38370.1 hypothetical protein B1207_00315 [Legionella quinlivanii]